MNVFDAGSLERENKWFGDVGVQDGKSRIFG